MCAVLKMSVMTVITSVLSQEETVEFFRRLEAAMYNALAVCLIQFEIEAFRLDTVSIIIPFSSTRLYL